jgi:hypothetical protein
MWVRKAAMATFLASVAVLVVAASHSLATVSAS